MTELHEKENLGSRTQVAKNPRMAKVKDKLLLLGVIGVCVMIVVGGLWPKHKTTQDRAADEKQDASSALNQNMALIAKLKENREQLQSSYHGSRSSHPPLLKRVHIKVVRACNKIT